MSIVLLSSSYWRWPFFSVTISFHPLTCSLLSVQFLSWRVAPSCPETWRTVSVLYISYAYSRLFLYFLTLFFFALLENYYLCRYKSGLCSSEVVPPASCPGMRMRLVSDAGCRCKYNQSVLVAEVILSSPSRLVSRTSLSPVLFFLVGIVGHSI